jgi:hypothetical protein
MTPAPYGCDRCLITIASITARGTGDQGQTVPSPTTTAASQKNDVQPDLPDFAPGQAQHHATDLHEGRAGRSHMQVPGELATAGHPREVGLGVYDIHSPGAIEATICSAKGLRPSPPNVLKQVTGHRRTRTRAKRRSHD